MEDTRSCMRSSAVHTYVARFFFHQVQKVLDQASKPLCEREFMVLMNTLPGSVRDTKDRGKMEAFQNAQKSLDAAMQKAVSLQRKAPAPAPTECVVEVVLVALRTGRGESRRGVLSPRFALPLLGVCVTPSAGAEGRTCSFLLGDEVCTSMLRKEMRASWLCARVGYFLSTEEESTPSPHDANSCQQERRCWRSTRALFPLRLPPQTSRSPW